MSILSCTTQYFEEKFSCEWIIKDASSILGGINQSISSNYFGAISHCNETVKWKLNYHTGTNKSNHSIAVDINIENGNFADGKIEFKAVMHVLDPRNDSALYEFVSSSYTQLKTPPNSNDINHRNYFSNIPNEKFFGSNGYASFENTLNFNLVLYIRRVINSKPEERLREKSINYNTFLEKISKGFIDGNFTDLEIKTATETLKCHKFILCAQSSVFSTMLKSPLKENQDNAIEIVDFDTKTVKGMLYYMYSGKIEEEDDFFNLLKIAHKYDVNELKEICERKVSRNINAENFLQLLECSEIYDLNFIKTKVVNYIKRNKSVLTQNKDFKELAKTNPAFIAQLYFDEI